MLTEILHSINEFGKTKLAPSLVCDGVGVFAISEISKQFILFQDVDPDQIYIPYKTITDPNVKMYLSCMCNSDKFGFYLSRTYNNINMSYYVNHSDTPNVYHDLTLDRYITIRDIQPGEELTCTYTKEEINWLT
jgi:SET domain-containing protein